VKLIDPFQVPWLSHGAALWCGVGLCAVVWNAMGGGNRGVETHNRRHDREVSLIDLSLSSQLGLDNGWVRKGKQPTCRVSGVWRKRTLVSRFATRSDRNEVKPRAGKWRVGRRVPCCTESFARDKARKWCVSVAEQTTAAFSDGRLRASAVSSKMKR
jgi:hypothetical protein